MQQPIYKQGPGGFNWWNSLVALLTSVIFSGCAVLHPYVNPLPQPDWSKAQLSDVVHTGNGLTTNLVDKRQSLHNFDFWSGALLIGTGIGTAGLGLYGAERDVITGTAIGAGTIVAGRTYVPMAERQKIYSTAVTAVQAAITNALEQDTFALRGAPQANDFATLDRRFAASAGEQLTTFQSLALLQSRAALHDTQRADELLASAEAQAQQGKEDLAHTLFETLSDIVVTVNSQIASEVLDPNAALAAATNKLGAGSKHINIEIDQAGKLLDRAEDKASMAKNATMLSLDTAAKFHIQGFDSNFQTLDDLIETETQRLRNLEALTGHFSY